MPRDNWKAFRLGGVCTKIGSGATPRGGADVYLQSSEVALIRSQNVYNEGFTESGLVYLSDEHAQQLANVEVREGDVLLNITGDSVARTCQVSPLILPARVNQHVAIVRTDPRKLASQFLRFFLVSPAIQQQLFQWASAGATRNALTKSMIESLVVTAPANVADQRAIVAVLVALEDKIELNRRMNETLEAMARAVFKAWFVDFEPVKAKAAGATSFPGMPQDVFDELPNELVENSDQEAPKGWPLKPVSELFEVNPTRRLTKGTIAPYLEMANMPTHGHAPDEWINRPFNSGMRFINGDTLVARITPCLENGKTAYVDFLADDEIGWGSTEYIVLRPKPPLPTIYAYCLARTESFREFLIQNMTGTSGRQRVSHTALDHIMVAEPSPTVAKAFGKLVAPWFALARNHKLESKNIAAIRDALLPKLLSGAIRVPVISSSPAETAYVD